MARIYSAIKRKTEDAIESLITKLGGTVISGVTKYKAFGFDETLTVPRIEIIAAKATPEILGGTVTGNWVVDCTVGVVSHYKDTSRDTHEQYINAIEDIIMRSDVASVINNLADITDYTVFSGVYGWMPGDGIDETNGSEIKSSYNVTIKCCSRRF